MNWLVTGGCGFLGTSLIRGLVVEGGQNVRVVDNLSVGTRKDFAAVCEYSEGDGGETFPRGVQLVVGDILDEGPALQAAQEADVIVHLAANTGVGPSVAAPRKDCTTNVIGNLNYLEAARQNNVKRFVFASSGAPVGECEPPIHEEMPPHPVSPYGASKLAGEGYCSACFHTFGIETVALRFGNVYGPGSGHKNSVVAKFIKWTIQGNPLEIYGDGRQMRDFIYWGSHTRHTPGSRERWGRQRDLPDRYQRRDHPVGDLVEKLVPVLRDAEIGNVNVRHAARRVGDVRRNSRTLLKRDGCSARRRRLSLRKVSDAR